MPTKKKPQSAFMAPVEITEELAAVVGKGPMPRTEITKKLWDYIKKHNLQDAKERRNINPDPKLAKIFGSPKSIDMFKMTSKLNDHIVKK